MDGTTRHDLATPGAWVELRDNDDLRAGERDEALAVVMGAADLDADGKPTMGDTSRLVRCTGAMVAHIASVLTVRWEVPYMGGGAQGRPTPAQLQQMRPKDYDRLLELVEPALDAVLPTRANVDDHDDPASPSVPASV